MLPTMVHARAVRWLSLFACGAAVVACAASAGNKSGLPAGSSSGGTTGGTTGGSTSNILGGGGAGGGGGGGGGGGTGGSSLDLGGGTDDDAAASGDACQHLSVAFVPRIPLVYVLVDGSGSMFTPNTGSTTDDWVPLENATLAVIQNLQSQVDFGFGDYGSNGSTGMYTPMGYAAAMCGILNNVPIAPNNYAAIKMKYPGDMQPYPKTNTPAQIALGQAANYLVQAAAAQTMAGTGMMAGGKYILLVTDGETDFCDDGNALCPTDAVIAEIESLYTQGITTLVLGLPSSQSNISAQALQGFANAGSGVPVQPIDTPLTIYQQCQGVPGWAALYAQGPSAALTGNNGVSLATYTSPDASVTNATLYSPNAVDVTDLTNQISTALATVKSCSFDLQGSIQVDVANAGEGRVTIDGTSIPYVGDSGANGWMMSSSTELDLVGSACQTWRSTGKDISFDFPCDILSSIPR
jgi:hypothetical protein